MTDKMDVDTPAPAEVDEGLYSRQLYVLGHETMRKMQTTNILLIGLGGLGVEIAKNIILMGVKAVTLFDPRPVSWDDLATNFYASEESVGKPRSQVVLPRLAELNQYVQVQVHNGALDEQFLGQYQVICVTDTVLSEQLRINNFSHSRGIKFVSADVRGVFARMFCDFGENFTVTDTNGEAPVSYMISAVASEGGKTMVTVLDEARILLEDGAKVTFTEVEGMTELNSLEPVTVSKVLGPYTCELALDTSAFGKYTQRGYIHESKQPLDIKFKSLVDSLANPDFLLSDFAKFESPSVLHLGFQALDVFHEKTGHYPRPHNEDDALVILQLVKDMNASFSQKVENVPEGLVKNLAYGAQGSFVGITASVGGIIAQELLKASSGKFMPLRQFCYFDAVEVLPAPETPADSFAPQNSRYDGQIKVLGSALNQQVLDLNYFLVGAGAIGCEMLKNWAMMGVGAGPKGRIHVTDMDTIERSNLSRQFLFRNKDIDSLKSATAAAAAVAMNPQLKVNALEHRVGAETETIFNQAFYDSLDGVCNALDNVEARLYMDAQCVFYRKPLLDSGTLGTKGNIQVVVPYLTESYASSRDPPEKSIPTCTLHHFPNKIDHTLQWARDSFEGLFNKGPEAVNSYITDANYLESLKKQSGGLRVDTLRTIHAYLDVERPRTFLECITWARLKFEDQFNHHIRQLLHNFPRDMITPSGQPFWSGPKRAPTPITFDAKNPLHLDFLIAASNLRAVVYGLTGERDPQIFLEALQDIKVPEFVPKQNLKINTDEKAETPAEPELDDFQQADELEKKLTPRNQLPGFRLVEIDFEKDKDDNFHMDFITAASNLRATNYSIPTADKHTSKGIAGKIIPAMVTTTAVVAGFVVIELLKLVQKKKLEDYKNGFLNLALPFISFSEPLQPPKHKVSDSWSWTLWDRFDLAGPLTLKQFLAYFEKERGLSVTMVSCGVSMLYTFFMNRDRIQERMGMEMSAIYKSVLNKEFDPNKNFLVFEICCNPVDSDEDVDVPYVCYRFRQ